MESLARDMNSILSTSPSPDAHAAVVTKSDFLAASSRVRPSITRGSEVDISPVQWSDVGGLHDVKERLKQSVEWPLRHREAFERMGLSAPRGVLLYGPPGCSKTTLVRALATSSQVRYTDTGLCCSVSPDTSRLNSIHAFQTPFTIHLQLSVIPLGCTQLYSMYVGEGEQNLREAFRRARLAAPSILFLDEIDALAPKRTEGGGGGSDVGTRLLSALLTEMDGLEGANGVIVIGATNRPQALDSALMRPGRLDVLVYVPPPDREGRLEALRVHSRALALDPTSDLEAVADKTDGYTGAELQSLCREAAFAALRSDPPSATVTTEHFTAALKEIRASVTRESIKFYERFATVGPAGEGMAH